MHDKETTHHHLKKKKRKDFQHSRRYIYFSIISFNKTGMVAQSFLNSKRKLCFIRSQKHPHPFFHRNHLHLMSCNDSASNNEIKVNKMQSDKKKRVQLDLKVLAKDILKKLLLIN